MPCSQVGILEHDVLEVLSLVRSMKNTFAPINRVPREVFSLIPEYCKTDEALVALTHVCRGRREQFVSRSSLWTSLDCTNVEKTRVYLKRSKASPLEVRLGEEECAHFLEDAFLLTVPHLGRLKGLSLSGSSNNLIQLVKHFGSPAPLLEKLKLNFTYIKTPVIQDTIFDGNFSSLRELRLSGVTANLDWTNFPNLVTFDLRHVPSNKMSVTRLLNFFERAAFLRKIYLHDAFPKSSDAPPGRAVSLPHLKYLNIVAQPAHTILLNHLLIPTGTSLNLEFDFNDNKPPISTYLPKTLKNLFHITSVNISFSLGMPLRLDGPRGTLYMLGSWVGVGPSPSVVDCRIFQSLSLFRISAAGRLAITRYRALASTKTEQSPVYQTLALMNNIRTLTLIDCLNLPFVFALNPKQNSSRTIVCPELEELVLYIRNKDRFCINELLEMVKERASSGAKLSIVTIIGFQVFVPGKEVFKLKNHVSRVEYGLDDSAPEWDALPTDVGGTGYESDW